MHHSIRKRQVSIALAAMAAMAAMAYCSTALAEPVVLLTALRVPFDLPIGLDEHEPSGRLLETRNYPSGAGGNLALMSLPVFGSPPLRTVGSPPATPFSSLAGVREEINILTVKSGHSFGAPVGTVFVADLTGLVRKLSADGSSVSNFAQLPSGGVGDNINLAMDSTGRWGGRMVASSGSGGLFLLDAAGNVETVATGMGRLQGVNFIPDDAARWGRFAGCIMAGTEDASAIANALTHLWCRASDGSISHETQRLGVRAEDIDVITDGNLYAIDFNQGRIWGAEAGAFASLQGEMLLTQELPGAGSSGLFHVGFDIASDSFTVEALDLHFSTGPASGHSWEQIVFSRIDMFNPAVVGGVPEPASLALALGALGLAGWFSRRR